MTEKLFGTDGIRGEAGQFPLDRATVRAIGSSLARRLAARLERAPRFVVGRDTRESGEWIEDAFLEGAEAGGAACESAGVITTPGVAFLARVLPGDAGVVFSASHNPYQDNGIKIFAPTGCKLDDATERLIEADIYQAREGPREDSSGKVTAKPTSQLDASIIDRAAALRNRYLDYLAADVAAGLRLDGMKIIVDCANGAASELAPTLFERMGADVVAIGNAPDGRNINRGCGSLHMEGLRRRVVDERAQIGVAFDGDADRALFVDAHGNLVDGDGTLWVLAKRMADREELAQKTVVATVMSNIGLEFALRRVGIALRRTDVGDKYVLEKLLRTGASLGGEQSGHIIFPQVSLAGDGMITAVQLLRVARETNRQLHELTEGFERYPQILTNVQVGVKKPFEAVEEIARLVQATEAKLEGRGRLLLRYSGTEPLARVMIEGEDQGEIELLAAELASVIEQQLGGS